jgi:lipid A 4'-phosphatase
MPRSSYLGPPRRSSVSEGDPPSLAPWGGATAPGTRPGVRLVLVRWVAPLLMLGALTALVRLTSADLTASKLFYGGKESGWSYANVQLHPALDRLYRWGPLPGVVLGIGGLSVGLLSLRWARLRPWRNVGFFFAAVLAVGPGLAVNLVAKPWFQRPRPLHIAEFGGSQAFVLAGDRAGPDTPENVGRSFPSGHASVGFILMAPAFVLGRRHRGWAAAFLLFGLVWGSVLGLGRIAQGDHFFSDVVWAGGLVYFSSLVLWSLFQRAERTTLSERGDRHSSAAIGTGASG